MSIDIDINIPGYTLIKEIGAGGMAKVYLGMQTLLERQVAIKILHQQLSAESDEFKKRFFVEGRVLAKLQHENIVSIIDIGEADGMLYMAMEYVENGTLTDWLKNQELTTDQAIQICSKVGLALHATHMQNIVHRDLKPSNILLRDINTPLLTDFGIARQTDIEEGLTQTGHIIGTLQYMSPEQIRGMHVDHRSDIYALGLMFYRLLVGQLPFTANSQYDLFRMQCEDAPPPLPPQLADLQPVMDAMLAKDPDDRVQSCLEFCKALQNLSITSEDYATELEGATRVYDSSQINAASFSSRRQTESYSEQFSNRTDTRKSGGSEQSRTLDGQQGEAGSDASKKSPMFGKPLKVALITLLAIAVIGTGTIVTMKFMPEPPVEVAVVDEKTAAEIEMLLESADFFLEEGPLINAGPSHAVAGYERVLTLQSGNPRAIQGLKTALEKILANIQSDIDSGDKKAARQLIQLAEQYYPGNEDLTELREKTDG